MWKMEVWFLVLNLIVLDCMFVCYWFEGFDDDWVSVKDCVVVYLCLLLGWYVLYVVVSDGIGVWEE